MARLYNYIKESGINDPLPPGLPKEVYEEWNFLKEKLPTIKRQCSAWIKELRGYPLFRGYNVGIRDKNVMLKKVRTDRKPVDMKIEDQKILDEVFRKKFGWNPRSEGMFCTPDWAIAGGYGKPGLVLVPGSYKYVWSENVQDLYGRVKRETDVHDGKLTTEIAEKLVNLYTDKDLTRAARMSGYYEITVKCNEYWVISIWLLQMVGYGQKNNPESAARDFLREL